jgi:4-alpha-glucanotransferase
VQGFGDPFCRANYPWGCENLSLLEFYKALGMVRKDCKAFTDGDFYTIYTDDNVIAYTRKNAKGRAFIAVNRGADIVDITVPGEFINSKNIFGVLAKDGEVTLGEYEYTIICV